MIGKKDNVHLRSPEQHVHLPSGWVYAPLGSVCRLVAGGTPSSGNTDYWVSDPLNTEGTPWIAISDMSQVDYVSSTSKSVSHSGMEAANLKTGKPGTVLFAMYASVGEVAVTDIAAVWNQAILGMTPTDPSKLSSGFLFYAAQSLRPYLPTYYRSNTQNNLNAATVAQLRIPLPPLGEQQRIADYLDRETAEIDAAVADLDRYVELLEQRRRLVVTKAVAGDVGPGEGFSGSWDQVPLRAVSADGGLFVDGDWVETKDQDPNGEIRLTQLADVGESGFLDKSDRWVNKSKFEELVCTEVLPGDLLIARMPDPIARCTVMPDGLGYSTITAVA